MTTHTSSASLLLLACATLASAQYGGYGGGGDPYGGGNGGSGSGGDGDGGHTNPGSEYGNGSPFASYPMMITAHAVMATLAFGFLFPVGGIMIRIASFPGLWWVHGLFQMFAYLLFTAAFAIGVYLATHLGLINEYHPIIGIVLFVLLAFQPVLGFLHHTMFRKYSRRTVWSHGHIWLGRIIITLGIINGGFGFQLANETHFFAPGNAPIIGYGVVAGTIWLIYIMSTIFGERKRAKASTQLGVMPPPERKQGVREAGRATQYA